MRGFYNNNASITFREIVIRKSNRLGVVTTGVWF